MSGLTLYTNAMSRGNTVDLFLKILDVPYQRVELDYGADMHTPEYL
ncbi:glutathione S-transferase family protein, partial [Salmonella enterica subsp. enterica serovar Chester]|nr:glutathione S-transferase family protein [Salmonella enterica subsp. enterica serovar Chester]